MRYIKFALFSLVVGLAGCASGPKYMNMSSSVTALQPEQGRIYFLRNNNIRGLTLQPDIKLDDVAVGTSRPGGFFYIDTDPGGHKVSTSTNAENNLTFVLEKGETKYVKTSPANELFVKNLTSELISGDQAQADLQELSYMGTTAHSAKTMAAIQVPGEVPSQVKESTAEMYTQNMAEDTTQSVEILAVPSQQANQINVYMPSESFASNAPNNALVSMELQKVTFTLGTSSNTVEKIGKQQGCSSSLGAGLLNTNGPVAIYRMVCTDGRILLARCELRQCTQMSLK